MGNYSTLKSAIQNAIKQNGNNEITGNLLQNSLISMINSLGLGYQYMGVLTPQSASPGTPDQNVFYFGFTAGNYFNGTTLESGQFAVFSYAGAGWSVTVFDTNKGLPEYLMDIKAVKDWGDNLVNPNTTTTSAYLNPDGEVRTASESGYGVTDFIPVVGRNIKTNARKVSTLVAIAVYDIDKNCLRVQYNNDQYTYQSGDYYIRFMYYNVTPQCNFGSTLLPYSSYTETIHFDKMDSELMPLIGEVAKKIDKWPSANLVNPYELQQGKYINPNNGGIGTGDNDYYVTGLISVFDVDGTPHNISSNALKYNYAASYVVYDSNSNIVRIQYGTGGTNKYTYQSGDYYVRFGFRVMAGESVREVCRANYGDTLLDYVPYSDYLPLSELEQRVDALDGGPEKQNLLLSLPNNVYLTYRSFASASRYAAKIWLSHLIKNSLDSVRDKNIKFSNGAVSFPVGYYNVPQARTQENRTIDVIAKESFNNTQVGYKVRIASASFSAAQKPRILVIGDSVTVGYGASDNRQYSWLPVRYWSFAKMLFEMDKADSGDSENYNALFIGRTREDVEMEYDGQTLSFTSCAEAAGGISLADLWGSVWGNDNNPFYDSNNQSFSIFAYLDNYRTMDDNGVRLPSDSANPSNEYVTGSDGLTYKIGSAITTQSMLKSYNICKPTHVFINLVHNSTLANFQDRAAATVSKIRTELGNIPIVWCVIDAAGTFFPNEYKLYNPDDIVFTGQLHFKNLNIYDYLLANIENETNNVYVLGLNFVQPTADSIPTLEFVSADSMFKPDGRGAIGAKVADPGITGPHYHPNNNAHSAWGYAVYSMLKYLMAA